MVGVLGQEGDAPGQIALRFNFQQRLGDSFIDINDIGTIGAVG